MEPLVMFITATGQGASSLRRSIWKLRIGLVSVGQSAANLQAPNPYPKRAFFAVPHYFPHRSLAPQSFLQDMIRAILQTLFESPSLREVLSTAIPSHHFGKENK